MEVHEFTQHCNVLIQVFRINVLAWQRMSEHKQHNAGLAFHFSEITSTALQFKKISKDYSAFVSRFYI